MRASRSLFSRRSFNKTLEQAKELAPPKQLFHSLIYEGEVTIIMADTNVGKSILAMQIGNDIAAKLPDGQVVLYVDMEMSPKQLETRYSDNYTNHYKFNDNFIRLEINPDASISSDDNYEELFINNIKNAIEDLNAAVVIIDNMSAIVSSDTDSAQKAKPLMDKLRELKREYGLTLIVLDHTRKTNNNKPISLNDLQGSKMKANFADAVFAIGRSAKDYNLRYLKQLKVRSSVEEYGADNVMVHELNKDVNNLNFKFVCFSRESEHLKIISDEERQERIDRAMALKEQGVSNREIARESGVSEGAVRKWIKMQTKKNEMQTTENKTTDREHLE